MTQLNNNKWLDNSTGIGQDNSNEAMQLASETTESPATEKKTPLTLKLIGKVGVVVMLVLSMLMIPPPIKTKAADPVTTTVTFIVVTAASWLIGDVLSSAKAALLAAASRPHPPEASANVNGAFWTTNWFENVYEEEIWSFVDQRSLGWTTETVTVSQGDYKLTNPVGTKKDGTAMSDSAARSLLRKANYSSKSVVYEVLEDLDDGSIAHIDDWSVHARTDSLEQEKAKELAKAKESHGDQVYFGTGYEISTTTYKVGDFKMESIFPPTKWPDLAHDTSEESGGDEYQGLLYWEYQEINETGETYGYTDDNMGMWKAPVKKDHRLFDFWSYKYDFHSHTVCEENQVLYDGNYDSPHISNGITRRFVVKPRKENRITKVFRRTGPFGFPMWDGRSYKTNSVIVGTKIDVEQYEPVYEGQ